MGPKNVISWYRGKRFATCKCLPYSQDRGGCSGRLRRHKQSEHQPAQIRQGVSHTLSLRHKKGVQSLGEHRHNKSHLRHVQSLICLDVGDSTVQPSIRRHLIMFRGRLGSPVSCSKNSLSAPQLASRSMVF